MSYQLLCEVLEEKAPRALRKLGVGVWKANKRSEKAIKRVMNTKVGKAVSKPFKKAGRMVDNKLANYQKKHGLPIEKQLAKRLKQQI